jgi:antitoxin ParD1/3/4
MANVHLTDELEEYILGKVSTGLYNSASEVVREALREKIERERSEAIEQRLTKLVLEGVDLGPPDGVSDEVWTTKRDALLQRVRQHLDQGWEELQRGEVVDGPSTVERIRRRLDSGGDEER